LQEDTKSNKMIALTLYYIDLKMTYY
jgi:hypothetical protein